MKPQTAEIRNLSNIAGKCGIAARALGEEVQFLRSQHAKGDLMATIQVAVKAN